MPVRTIGSSVCGVCATELDGETGLLRSFETNVTLECQHKCAALFHFYAMVALCSVQSQVSRVVHTRLVHHWQEAYVSDMQGKG